MDQEMIGAKNHYVKNLEKAFAKLPNMRHIVMSTEICLLNRSASLRKSLRIGLQTPFGDHGHSEACGVRQLRSLLLAAAASGLKLDCLECGLVHWYFLRQRLETLEKMRAAMQSLTMIAIHIVGGIDDHPLEDVADYLRTTGRLRAFAAAAPNLKYLEVTFDLNNWFRMVPPVDLSDIVGDFLWPGLESAAFAFIGTDKDAILNFFNRHASTLKEIRLEIIHQRGGDQWPRVLQSTRKIMQLKSATITGRLSSDAGEIYHLNGPPPLANLDYGRSLVRVTFEDYLLAGGEGPLLDINSILNTMLQG